VGDTPFAPGDKVGKYRLERLIGKGAMGAVYLATDTLLGRQVALKAIIPTYAGDPHFKARFLREARTLAKVNHPNVVQIYDVYDPELQLEEQDTIESPGAVAVTVPYLVTEYVDGRDLYSLIHDQGALPWRRAAILVRQVAQGLGAAAEQEIVHRDVKPGNILVAAEVAKITDFGLAKPLVGDENLTQAEVVMGTPDYMAPEQALGQPIDWRADAYALGCTMFQMLTGRTPYGQGSPISLCRCHIYEPFPRIIEYMPNLPSGLIDLMGWLVEKDPARRPESYQKVVDAIQRLLGPTRESGDRHAFIVIENGRQLGLRTIINDRPVIVGRLPDSDVSIDEPRVSRRHATFQPTPAGIEVRDLGSRNGVIVNGNRVQQTLLNDGDRVTIGDTVFRFALPAPPSEPHRAAAAPARNERDKDPFAKPGSEIDPFAVFTDSTRKQRGSPAAEPEAAAPPIPAELLRAVSPSAAALLAVDGAKIDPGLLRYRRAEVAVVRFNLTGAARLAATIDPAALAQALNGALEALVRAVFVHRGSVDTLTSESLLAVFGVPIELTDVGEKAVQAAIDGIAAVNELQQDMPADQRINVRAGIGAGLVVAGLFGTPDRRDFGVVGLPVEVARSLGAMAPPSGILVSDDVQRLLGDRQRVVKRIELTASLHGRQLEVYEIKSDPED